MKKALMFSGIFIFVYVVIAALNAQAAGTSDAELRTLRAENAMLKTQIATLKKKVADLSGVRGENAVLKKQVAELGQAVKAAGVQVQGLLQELARVRAAASRPAKVNVVTAATKPAPTSRPVIRGNRPSAGIASRTTRRVRIDLVAAVVGEVPLLNEITDRTGSSEKKLLRLTVRVTNLSTTKKINYRTWGAARFEFTSAFSGALTDELKNTYKRIHFEGANIPVGRCKRTSIYPEKSVQDILVFEVPVAKAKQLILLLPLKNIDGGDGIVKLVIPMKAVENPYFVNDH